jgi:Zn-dependent M28 family amino/carboxypeptidase
MRVVFIICAVIFLTACAGTGKNAAITAEELTLITGKLASDRFFGRGTGTGGDSLAALYILNEFEKAGANPYMESGLQSFSVNVAVEPGKNNRLIIDGHEFMTGTDFMPLALSADSSLSARVVFCGYGLLPSGDTLHRDDFSGLDLSGQWAMVLRGYPESDPALAGYASVSIDRIKVLNAREKGAAGVLLVSGEKWDVADNLEKPSRSEARAGVPVLQIRRSVADSILKNSGTTIKELEERTVASISPEGLIAEVVVDAEADVEKREAVTSNVVMMLKGSSKPGEYVIVGAHYDHLGMGGPGSSSRVPDTTAIHYGADDNASGVALMIELAEQLAAPEVQHARNIIFVAFSGEEMGLLGSKQFVENMGMDPSAVNLMINLDMVGRMKEGNGLQVGGVGTAEGLRDSVISYSDTTAVRLSFTQEGYGPSDHSSFYGKDIPVLYFTTGAHLDYHTPFDTPDKINYDGMVKVGDLLTDLVTWAASSPSRLAFMEAGPREPTSPMGRRRGITFGIMPDFAGNVTNGLRADFVTPGKPAAQAGMVKGDIIVAIDSKPVRNIEDYMFRLSQLKPGQTVPVEVLRDGIMELLIIQL